MCKKPHPFLYFFLSLAALIFPFVLILIFVPRVTGITLVVYLIYLLSLVYFLQRNRFAFDRMNLATEEVQENLNVSEREQLRLLDLRTALTKKIKSYQRLEKFTERLNNEISLDRICEIVVQELFDLFGSNANVLLYLINEKNRRPELHSIRKVDASVPIKEKTGDPFDLWVLRHNQPLLVEDCLGDFRFDPDKIKAELSRPVGSLIDVPMVTEAYAIGLLRIDASSPKAFFADDLRFLSVIADIAKLAIENAVYFAGMQALSITDGLTGIYLRRFGMERLKEEFLRAQRDDAPLSFLMIDIDNFKIFNDKYGHMGGDVVLKKLAKSLKNFFDFSGSIVFRYGGEEFSVLLPMVQKSEAKRLAESFRKALSEKEIMLRGEKVKITVSIGIASFPADAREFEDLMRCSDEALLKAKRSGRDNVCCL